MKIKQLVAGLAAIIIGSCTRTPAEVAATSVELSDNDIELIVGQTYTLSATVLPDNATNKVVEWMSTNPEVVKRGCGPRLK